MQDRRSVLYTIGHSTHSLESFVALLQKHGVTAVADVRSHPYSRLDHFNREALAGALEVSGIRYVFMGRELGARRVEQECYQDAQAMYRRIAELPAFQEGLRRIHSGAPRHVIALMCAEKEPLDCHRTILVCRHLRNRGLAIRHILADGAFEDHDFTERRLVKQMGIEPNLFEPDLTEADLVERAYEQRGMEIAYQGESEEP